MVLFVYYKTTKICLLFFLSHNFDLEIAFYTNHFVLSYTIDAVSDLCYWNYIKKCFYSTFYYNDLWFISIQFAYHFELYIQHWYKKCVSIANSIAHAEQMHLHCYIIDNDWSWQTRWLFCVKWFGKLSEFCGGMHSQFWNNRRYIPYSGYC